MGNIARTTGKPVSLFEGVSERTAGLIFRSVPENTRRAYETAANQFARWLAGRRPNDKLLADYVTYLYEEENKAPASISIAVAAVNWVSTFAGSARIGGVVTKKALESVRKMDATRVAAGLVTRRGQVAALTWNNVERVCGSIESTKTARDLRDSALVQLMSDCLLRVSEAVAVNVSDLKGKTLFIARSKTDQTGRGKHLYVTEDTRDAVRKYRRAAGITSGALFRRILKGGRVTEQRLTAGSAREIIKARASRVGFANVSGHSLRVGSAVSLVQAGASVVDLQTEGRWKDSRMPAHYADAVLAEQGAIARFKEGRKQ